MNGREPVVDGLPHILEPASGRLPQLGVSWSCSTAISANPGLMHDGAWVLDRSRSDDVRVLVSTHVIDGADVLQRKLRQDEVQGPT